MTRAARFPRVGRAGHVRRGMHMRPARAVDIAPSVPRCSVLCMAVGCAGPICRCRSIQWLALVRMNVFAGTVFRFWDCRDVRDPREGVRRTGAGISTGGGAFGADGVLVLASAGVGDGDLDFVDVVHEFGAAGRDVGEVRQRGDGGR